MRCCHKEEKEEEEEEEDEEEDDETLRQPAITSRIAVIYANLCKFMVIYARFHLHSIGSN